MRGVVVALACSLRSISPRSLRSAYRGAGSGLPSRSPRWVHRDLPRAVPPDSWRSQRGRAGPSYGLPGRAASALATGAPSTSRQLATTAHHHANLSGQNTRTGVLPGTGSSNPALSSGESIANLTFGAVTSTLPAYVGMARPVTGGGARARAGARRPVSARPGLLEW